MSTRATLNNLYCIVGRSGSGKTTLVDNIAEKYGVLPVASYTTRPMRVGEVNGEGHIFISDDAFKDLKDLVAYTYINGYHYGVTKDILKERKLYVIDPPGIEFLKRNYNDTPIIVIGLLANEDLCRTRMGQRGDSEENIEKRLSHDKEAFKYVPFISDVVVNASESEELLTELVWSIIQSYEKYGELPFR